MGRRLRSARVQNPFLFSKTYHWTIQKYHWLDDLNVHDLNNQSDLAEANIKPSKSLQIRRPSQLWRERKKFARKRLRALLNLNSLFLLFGP